MNNNTIIDKSINLNHDLLFIVQQKWLDLIDDINVPLEKVKETGKVVNFIINLRSVKSNIGNNTNNLKAITKFKLEQDFKKAIFEILTKSEEPISASDILIMLKQNYPDLIYESKIKLWQYLSYNKKSGNFQISDKSTKRKNLYFIPKKNSNINKN